MSFLLKVVIKLYQRVMGTMCAYPLLYKTPRVCRSLQVNGSKYGVFYFILFIFNILFIGQRET